MNHKDKRAIENLIIISRYMEDNSILTARDEEILRHSIHRAERLIGLSPTQPIEEIELGDINEIDIEALIKALKNKKKS